MFVCAAGDIHGALDQMYADISAFEEALALRFDGVLHVGDFGVWTDPTKIDAATKNHDGPAIFQAGFQNAALPRAKPSSSKATTKIFAGSMRSLAQRYSQTSTIFETAPPLI